MAVKQRFPWIRLGAAAAFFVVMPVAWLQIPTEPASRVASATGLPWLEFKRLGRDSSMELVAQKLEAYDPRPLFVPSWMNSNGTAEANESLRTAEGPFAELPPKLVKDGPLRFPATTPRPDDAVAMLRLTESPVAPLALGRTDAEVKPLAKRLAGLEAVDAKGRVVLAMDLPAASGDTVPEGDWQPLELAGAVSPAGLVGELVITSGSGADRIDEYFRSHLRQNVRIGGRLPEGFYTFRVGP
jgi:hypothetical protein